MARARRHPRPRRQVELRKFAYIKPLFRYSSSRGAYVLRAVGRKVGPVIQTRP